MMSCYYIVGLRLDNRTHNAAKLQEVLTNNGCNIKVRLGLHEASEDVCANDGLIILQPCGEKKDIDKLVENLNALDGVKAKLMDLN